MDIGSTFVYAFVFMGDIYSRMFGWCCVNRKLKKKQKNRWYDEVLTEVNADIDIAYFYYYIRTI